MKTLLTDQEAAMLLKLSPAVIASWRDKGFITPHIAADGRARYHVNDLQACLRQYQAAPKPLSDNAPKQPKQKKKIQPKAFVGGFVAIILLTTLGFAGSIAVKSFFGTNNSAPDENQAKTIGRADREVLATRDRFEDFELQINIPAVFSKPATFLDSVTIEKELSVAGVASLSGGIVTNNADIDAGTGTLTASNVVYGLIAGNNITISGDPQNPTISTTGDATGGVTSFQGQVGAITLADGSGIGLDGLTITNTGVLSLGGQTGDISLTGGTGISVSGTTITNTDTGSSQNIFKSILTDTETITASANDDSLTFAAGSGITITGDAANKTITITSNASGTLSGLTPNGVLYATTSTNATSTAPGTTGTVLKGVTAGVPVFGAVDLTTDVTGVLPIANGGTGISTTATNGQLLIGNGSGYTLGTLTAGAGIGITNGSGTISVTNNGVLSLTGTANQITTSGSTGMITLSLPQDIATTSTPTFASLNLTANTNQLTLGTGTTGVITLATLTSGRTYTLPDVSGEICVSGGNCPGNVSGSGAVGYIPRFVSAATVGNSNLFDTGTKVGLGTTTPEGYFTVSGAAADNALVILNETGTQDILTGSASGTTRFVFDRTGNLNLSGGGLQINGTTVIDASRNITNAENISADGNITFSSFGAGVVQSNGSGVLSSGALDLASGGSYVTGILPVGNGGTGISSVGSAGSVAYSNGSTYAFSTVGTSGQVLVSNGSSAPSWVDPTSIATSNWQRMAGAVSPSYITDDVLVGGTSTASATFQVSSSGNLRADGTIQFSNFTTGVLLSDGSGNISASTVDLSDTNYITGTLGIGNGGTGISTTATNGQLLIGNGSGYTLSTLTAGTGIGITNGAGSITIANTGVTSLSGTANQVTVSGATGAITLSLPQDINTTSSPTFNGLTVSSLTRGTDTITDFTGTGLQLNAGSLETTLGTSVDLTSEVTGTLPVANGGTGITAVGSAGSVAYSDGSAFAFTAVGTGGQVLVSNGSGAPTWADASGIGTNYWQRSDGVLAPINITDDLVIGGAATSSARFRVSGTDGNLFATGTLTGLTGLSSSGTVTFSDLGTGVVQSNGSGVLSSGAVDLSDTNYVTGTLGTGNGGTGLATTASNGQLLIGNGAGYTLSTLTAGTGISVSNGSGSITINNTGVTSLSGTTDQVSVSGATGAVTLSLPQSIATTSSPTFNGLSLSSLTIGGDTISDFVGTGLQLNAGTLETTLGTSVDLTSEVAGTLPVANGGTGATAVGSAGSVAYSNGTTYAFTNAGSNGQLLASTGTGAPTWINPASVGTNYWQRNDGTLAPLNISDDLLIGGISTAAATFQVSQNGNLRADGTITFSGFGTGVLQSNASGSISSSAFNLSNTNYVTGTLGTGNGGTGITSTPNNGQLLIGNGAGYTLTVLTAGTGIGITNGSGSITLANTGVTSLAGTANQVSVSGATGNITLSLPQDINTTSSPTFNGLTVSSLTRGSDTITDFTGTGLQLNAGSLETTLGTSVDLTSEVTGTLPVANGGTGRTTVGSAGSVAYSDGSLYAFTAVGTSGQVLSSTGTGAPTWIDASGVGVNYWQRNDGALAPKDISDDLLVGGISTASAAFQVTSSGNLRADGSVTFSAFGTGALLSNGSGSISSGAINLASSSYVTGTLGFANGGTGLSATASNGQLLIGNGAGYTLSTLTAGTGIGISNGSGSISINNTGVTSLSGTANQVSVSAATGAVTLSLPQDINTTSSPTFNGLSIASLTRGADTITDFTGTGLQINAGALETTLGTSVDLTSEVTGTLPVANGGTGITSVGSAGSVAYSDGSTYAFTNVGTSGQVLSSTGTGAPTWIDASGVGTNYWQRNNGTLAPLNITDDLLVGGVSTAAATFQVTSAGNLRANGNVTFSSFGTGVLQSNGSGSISSAALNLAGGASYVTGTLPTGNGGTGLSTTATNGQLLIGNGAGYTLSTLSAGTGISVTNGSGSITIANTGVTSLAGTSNQVSVSAATGAVTLSLPQDIATTSTPTFSSLFLTSNTNQLTLGTSNTGTITMASLTGSRTYTLPDETGTFCLTSGNCAGVGGVGDIGAVGDVTSGDAFTASGTQGTSLYFYDADGRGQLTIADLTAVRTFTLPDASGEICLVEAGNCAGSGSGITGSGTAGQIAYFDASANITSEASGFAWDATNNRLGLGNDTPAGKLDVAGSNIGKALVILNETGDQDILVGSASGSTQFSFSRTGNLNLSGSLQTGGTTRLSNTGNLSNIGTINASGAVTFSNYTTNGGILYTNGSGTLAQTSAGTSGQLLQSNGGGAPTWVDASSVGTNYWQRNAGALSPLNITDDLLLGATATSSALVKFTGTSGGNSYINTGNVGIGLTAPGARLAVQGSGAGSGKVFSTTNSVGTEKFAILDQGTVGIGGSASTSLTETLTINVPSGATTVKFTESGATRGYVGVGDGSTFGAPNNDIFVRSESGQGIAFLTNGANVRQTITSSGNVGIGDTTPASLFTVGSGDAFQVNSTGAIVAATGVTSSGTITFSSLGTGVVQSNGSGVLSSAALNLAGGSSYITGTLPVGNGGTGITSVGSAGSVAYSNGTTYAFTSVGSSGQVLSSTGTGAPTWIDAAGVGTNYWQRNAGTLAPLNITDDLLVGGIATGSATFQVTSAGNLRTDGTVQFSALGTGILKSDASGNISSSAVNLASGDVTGTLPTGRGGTGLSTTAANGELLIGNGSGYTLSTLTAGTGIGISNGSGSITISNTGVTSLSGTANQVSVSGATGAVTLSLPQDINTTSSPTFNGLTVSSLTRGADTITDFTGTGLQLNAGSLETTLGTSVDLTSEVTGTLPIANGGTGRTTIGSAGSVAYSNGSIYSFTAVGTSGQLLVSSGTGAPTWIDASAVGTNYWQRNAGAISPVAITDDLLLGATATSSALVKLTGTSGGNSFINTGNVGIGITSPSYKLDVNGTFRASSTSNAVFGNGTTGGIQLGDSTITKTSGSYFSFGSGITTGGYQISGNTVIDGSQNLLNITNVTADGTITFSSLGTGVVQSNSSGVLSSAALNLAGGSSYITGTLPVGNGGTGSTSVGSAGSVAYSDGSTYGFTTVGSSGQLLQSTGTGTPTWVNASAVGTNYWQRNNGTLSPLAITDDLLLGATATSSALVKFTGTSGGDSFINTGNVGIGTTSPNAKLTVQGGSFRTYTSGQGDLVISHAGLVSSALAASSVQLALGANNAEAIRIATSGNVGVGDTTPASLFTVGNGDLFQVNASGQIAAATGITSSGTITFSGLTTNGGVLYTNGSGTLAQTSAGTSGQLLQSNGGGAPTWVDSASVGTNYWQRNAGALSPLNISDTLLLGATSTASARIKLGATSNATSFFNTGGAVGIGTNAPTSLLSVVGSGLSASTEYLLEGVYEASTARGVYLGYYVGSGGTTQEGRIRSGAGVPLAIGTNGSAQALYITNAGNIGIGDTSPASLFTVGSGDAFQVNSTGAVVAATGITSSGTITFSGLSTGVVQSNGSGVLSSAALNLAGGASYITGTLPVGNGGTGATSVGSAGSVAYSNGSSYAFTSVGSSGQVLQSTGTGAPTWIDASGVGTNYWQRNGGALSSLNITDDILTGAIATSSALVRLAGTSGANSFFNTGGNVGIGTTSPGYLLDVVGSGQVAEFGTDTLTDQYISVRNLASGLSLGIDASLNGGNGAGLISAGSNKGLAFRTSEVSGFGGSTPQMYLDTSGNLGIGTTSPQGKLHVAAGLLRLDDDYALEWGGTNSRIYGSEAGGYVRIRTQNTDRLTVANGGNVGIGTISPTALLDVAGAASVSGSLTFRAGAGSIQTTANNNLTIGGGTTGNILLNSDGSNSVGIGTATPQYALDVNYANTSTSPFNTFSQFGLRNKNATNNNYTEIAFHGFNNIAAGIAARNTDHGNSYAELGFYTRGSSGFGQRMVIQENGNVGIGDTTPASLLTVGSGDAFQVNSSGAIAAATGITSSGTVTFSAFTTNGGLLYTNGSGVLAQTLAGASGECLKSVGGGTPTWAACNGTGSADNYWQRNAGVVSPYYITDDLVLGATATSSALVKFTGTSGGNSYVNTGNFGIGTTTPSQLLNIASLTSAQLLIQADTDNVDENDVASLRLEQDGGVTAAEFGINSSNNAYIGSVGINDFYLRTNNTNRLTVSSGGNVGIATSSPDSKLTVSGATTGKALVSLNETGDQDIFTASSSGTSRFVIKNNGRVGIGTTTPNAALEVAGRAYIGDITQTSTANQGAVLYTGNTANASAGLDIIRGGSGWTASSLLGLRLVSDGGGVYRGALGFADSSTFTERLSITSGGNIGIGDTSPASLFTVGSGDLFQVNSSGAIAAATGITSSGTIQFSAFSTNGGLLYTNGAGTVAQTAAGSSGQILQSNGSGAPTWVDASTIGVNYWQRSAGALAPVSITDDLVLGATATSSALVKLTGTSGNNSFINTGNFGIGTNAPTSLLDVVSATDATATIRSTNTSGGAAILNLVSGFSGTNGDASIRATIAELRLNAGTVGGTNRFISFYPDGTERLRITSTGNVGIGTTSPASKLTVSGATTGKALVSLNETGDQDIFTASSSGTSRFVIKNDGKVGIATTSPVSALHVNGSGSFGDSVTGSLATRALNLVSTDAVMRVYRLGVSGDPAVELLHSSDGGASADTYWDFYAKYSNDSFNIRRRTSGNTDMFTILSSGNVGIGDTSPASLFTVGSGDLFQVNSTGAIAAATGITSSGTIQFSAFSTNGGLLYTNGSGTVAQTGAGTSGQILQSNGSGAPTWVDAGAAGLTFWQRNAGVLSPYNITDDLVLGATATSSALVKFSGTSGNDSFINTGSLGLGTKTPGAKLDIESGTGDLLHLNGTGTGNTIVRFQDDGVERAALFTLNGSSDFRIRGQGDVYLDAGGGSNGDIYISSAGNVGIGTTSPTALLDVNGAASVSGNLTFRTGTGRIQTTANNSLILGGDTTGSVIVQPNNGTGTTFFNGIAQFNTASDTYPVAIGRGSSTTSEVLRTGLSDTVVNFHYINDEANGAIRFRVQNTDTETGGGAAANDNTLLQIYGDNTGGYVDIGSITAGLRVNGSGTIADIDGNVVIADTVDLGSATAGVRIDTSGNISDIDGSLVLNDDTYIGSATTGLNVSTTGVISDVDGSFVILNDNLQVGNTANQAVVIGQGATNHGIEIGRTDGSSSTPFIDFHSGATATDYDARLIASGGTGSSSGGTLTAFAATLAATGNLSVGGSTGVTVTGNGAGVTFSGTGNHDITASAGTLRLGATTLTGAITGGGNNITGLGNLSAAGTVTFSTFASNGGLLYTNGSGVLAQTTVGTSGQCLLSSGGGSPTWGTCASGTNYWQKAAGTIAPLNITDDLVLGATATASATIKLSGTSGNNSFINTGNFGVGTTTPTLGKIQINKDSTYSTENSAGLYILSSAADSALALGADGTNDIAYIQSLQQGTSYTTRPLAINPNGGNVGIGILPSSNSKLYLYSSTAAASANGIEAILDASGVNGAVTAVRGTINDTATSASSTTVKNAGVFTYNKNGTSADTGYQAGAGNFYANVNAGSVAELWNVSSRVQLGGATVTNANDFVADAQYGSSGTATARTGFYVRDWNKAVGQSLTNQYGLRIDNLTTATNNYSIYTGSAQSYFGGNVGVGTTTPANKLSVNGAITGKALVSLNETGNQDIFTASSSGTTRFVITNGGSVGVGLSNPSSILQTYQNNSFTGGGAGITIEQAGTGDSVVQYLLTGVQRWVSGVDNSDSDKFKIGRGADWASGTDIGIDTSGNVGIGTSTPNAKFDVFQGTSASRFSRDTNQYLEIVTDASSNRIIGRSQSGNAKNLDLVADTNSNGIRFMTNSSGTTNVRMTIDSSGNVGIGDATPSQLFTVGNGDLFTVDSTGYLSGTGAYFTGVVQPLAVEARGYATSNTSNTNVGEWTKLASCTISSQYQDCRTTALVAGVSDGAGTVYRAIVDWRVKQQNALGGAPAIDLQVLEPEAFTKSDFVSVTTTNDGSSTVAELWGRINYSYQSWKLSPMVNGGSVLATWYSGQGFSVSLPAGTQTASTYSDGAHEALTIAGLTTGGGVLFTNSSGVVSQTTAGTSGQCLQSTSGGTPTWGTCGGNSSYWQLNAGVISPFSNTADVTIGGTSTASAKFQVSQSGTATTAQVTGNTAKAALGVNQTGSGDIFTASASGTTQFKISNAGVVTIGNTTNGITFDPASGPTYYGNARPSKTISLNPEYAGAVVTANYGHSLTDTSINGIMTSDIETTTTNGLRNYYQWNSSQASLNYYTVAVRVKLPKDFGAWETSNALQVEYMTQSTSTANNVVDVRIFREDNTTAVATSTSNVSGTANTWTTASFAGSSFAGSTTWNTVDQVAVIYLRMGSKSSNNVRIGEIKLNYKAKF